MSKERILIIDDDPVFIRLLQADLRVAGYEVFTAKDGYKGIQMARSERPDLIIMDIMMPGMDGHKTSEIIKKAHLTASIPIIYVTAKDGLLDEELAMELGAEFFIKKPYEPNVLLPIIKRTLRIKEQRAQRKDRILVIESDLNIIDEIKSRLKQRGFRVDSSLSMKEGLDKARSSDPNLILLDGALSRSEQHAHFKVMKQDEHLGRTPVIVFTRESDSGTIMSEMTQATRFLLKPINHLQLMTNIEDILEK